MLLKNNTKYKFSLKCPEVLRVFPICGCKTPTAKLKIWKELKNENLN